MQRLPLTKLEQQTLQVIHNVTNLKDAAQDLGVTPNTIQCRLFWLRKKGYETIIGKNLLRKCGFCKTSINHRTIRAVYCKKCASSYARKKAEGRI